MEAVKLLTGETVQLDFFTAWERPLKDQSEHPDPKSITETAYVPPQVQIKDMMDAGVALAASRKARFDSVELRIDEDIPLDPTREPGVDLVDIQRQAEAVSKRLEEARGVEKVEQEKAQRAEQEKEYEAEVEKRLAARQAKQEEIKNGG
jgi:hypothetical protein